MDPKAEDAYGQTPYNSMWNNPTTYTDPNGDFAIMASIVAGAAIGAFVNGAMSFQKGEAMTNGWWKGAITGAIGGAMAPIGGGTFVGNMAWGAAQGAVTGGIGAELNGGNFGEGAWKGAIWGAAIAGAVALPESIKNANDGYGFGTNMGRFNKLARDAVGADMTVDIAKAQKSLDFWSDRFGQPSMLAVPGGSGHISRYDLTPKIPAVAFKNGPAFVRLTIAHEMGHLFNSIQYDALGNVMLDADGHPQWMIQNDHIVPGHGTIGYDDAIRYSGNYHIPLKLLRNNSANYSTNPHMKYTWWAYNKSKWIHVLPKRSF